MPAPISSTRPCAPASSAARPSRIPRRSPSARNGSYIAAPPRAHARASAPARRRATVLFADGENSRPVGDGCDGNHPLCSSGRSVIRWATPDGSRSHQRWPARRQGAPRRRRVARGGTRLGVMVSMSATIPRDGLPVFARTGNPRADGLRRAMRVLRLPPHARARARSGDPFPRDRSRPDRLRLGWLGSPLILPALWIGHLELEIRFRSCARSSPGSQAAGRSFATTASVPACRIAPPSPRRSKPRSRRSRP